MTRVMIIALLGVVLPACGSASQERRPQTFAAQIESLSERGGYFDTDNLISNETAYLHVIDALDTTVATGGVYIGVGPDQNFSYIAAVRPAWAFIVDIRRDNMLQHLLFKALFTLAETRVEYLALLFGRPHAGDISRHDRSVDRLVSYIENGTASNLSVARARVDSTIRTFGLKLTAADFETIERFHRTFAEAGLSLRFTTFGRGTRFYYPTYRDLMLSRDLTGDRANYLATRAGYEFVRDMQMEDRIVPVVGDLAGPHAVRAIGAWVDQQNTTVSAFYTSNVEFYLFRNGTFDAFAANVASLPVDDRSVIIRSVFHSTFGSHPLAVPGHYSTQLLQRIRHLSGAQQTGDNRAYWSVVTRNVWH